MRGDDVFLLTLEYETTPWTPASWDGPSDGGEIETLNVLRDGSKFELTDAETTEVHKFIADYTEF